MNPIVLHWVTTNIDRNISRNKEIYQQCYIFIFSIKYSRHATTISGILFLSSSSLVARLWLVDSFIFLLVLMNIMKEGKNKSFVHFIINTSLLWRKVVGVWVVKIVTAELCCLWRKEGKKAFLHYSYLKSLYYSCLSFKWRTTEQKNISLEKSVHDKIPP